jgi:acetolactate synthase-1/2/3 large subunit
VIKVSDYVLDSLVNAGAKHVFLVPGGAAMHLNDSLAKNPMLTYTSAFHENAASVAAEAFSKLTNTLGVAMVTGGPGSTNAITGVASAWVNSAPLVVLSGQVKSSDLNQGRLRQSGLQEVDIESIVRPITKYVATIRRPDDVRRHVETAIHLARDGRPGPVWLDIPMDIQGASIDPATQAGMLDDKSHKTSVPDNVFREIIHRWSAAKRPVILAGAGIRIAGGESGLLLLAERTATPVQTTWIGADLIPAQHPLYAGRPGAFASRAANFTIQNADFVLAIGARFDFATTGFSRERFARGAFRIAVDCDPHEIEKLQGSVEIGVVEDARVFIEHLLQVLPEKSVFQFEEWQKAISEWNRRYPLITEELSTVRTGVSTYVLVDRLSSSLEPGDVIVEGSSGVHSEIFFMAFDVKKNQRIIADGSFGSMGYGLPAAIGACVAAGRQRTILVDGDGSLQPQLQELETLRRENLPIKIFVVNNDGYSSIRVSQNRYFNRLVGADARSGLTIPSFDKIAAAYGLRYAKIDNQDNLTTTLASVLAGGDPVICEVVVPSEEDRVPRLANMQKQDGTMVSKPLEDLFPFLPRDEFLENMIIPPIDE